MAAAVGGYILLSAGQRDEGDAWPEWLSNLTRYFTYLPDDPILCAKWLLSQQKEENLKEAHELLYTSVERGIPYFTIGVIWLIEGLEQTSIGCDICEHTLRMVRGVARSMDLSQTFTSFTIAKPWTREDEETNPDILFSPGTAREEPPIEEVWQRTRWEEAQSKQVQKDASPLAEG